jgi:hypothetical protein
MNMSSMQTREIEVSEADKTFMFVQIYIMVKHTFSDWVSFAYA